MSYTIIEDWTTPNQSSRASYGWTGNPDGITWHWWGHPKGDTLEGTVNFFVNISPTYPVENRTSAHFVVSDKRVACIVSPTEAAWHAGNTEGNGRTIGIEVDPALPGETLETCAELAADLERQFGSLNHYGHRDWTSTECPGVVYGKIPWIIQRTNEILGNGGGGSSSGGTMEPAVKWMTDRSGAVTYSMDYRLGPNSYDCSSSVYLALQAAGINTTGTVGNTETMFSDLPAWGFTKVYEGYGTKAQRPGSQFGDIFVWGVPGASSGAGGHTGIFVDNSNIVHCNFGYNGITINNYEEIWTANQRMYQTIYRRNTGGAQSLVSKDWFDMASRQDLSEVVNDVIQANGGFIRQMVHRVLFDERVDRQGTVNGKPVGGTTTFALEIMYMAQNFGRARADIIFAQNQIKSLEERVKNLEEGK